MPSVPSGTASITNLPQGFDRADGLQGRIGQATTGLTAFANGSTSASTGSSDIPDQSTSVILLNEAADSPTMERAEQCTIRHRYITNSGDALARWNLYPRGTLVVDSFNNYYRVLSCTYNRLRGDTVALDIVTEAMSFDSPPDEFNVSPVNLGLDIMKHPRYFYSIMPTSQIPGYTGTPDSPDEEVAKGAIIRAIQAYRENPWVPTTGVNDNISGSLHDNITSSFQSGKLITYKLVTTFDPTIPATAPVPIGSSPPAVPVAGNNPKYQAYYIDSTSSTNVQMALAAAKEVIQKLWRMEDSPMVNGIELSWSSYYWRPPSVLNLGSYVEDPIAAGLPDYFYSPAQPPDSSTIFDGLCSLNPQIYSSTGTGVPGTTKISWLRCADTLEFQRTWFKVTRKWMGAPIGAWDAQFYNQNPRPSVPTDYIPLTYTST